MQGPKYTYTDDRLDSRDLLERLDELADREDDESDPLDEDEIVELVMLRELRDETEGYAGDSWRDGVAFVSDRDFENYAQELAEDVCDIDFGKLAWPLTCIDWEQAAGELRMDYSSCEIDGRTYWYQ
jgi:hypothetical protein